MNSLTSYTACPIIHIKYKIKFIVVHYTAYSAGEFLVLILNSKL